MNVLFMISYQDTLTEETPLHNAYFVHFGISFIASILRENGHTCKLLVLTRRTRQEKVFSAIDEYSPGLICFTAVYSEYGFITEIAKSIKGKYPEIFLIAGGVHVTLNPDACIKDPFDAICIGEGEYPALELVSQLEKGVWPSGIANLWIKNGEVVEKNPPRPFVEDLDTLPFPYLQMWEDWIAPPIERFSVLLGRGCPYNCSYCSNHALRKITTGQYVRMRSPENIVEEIREIAETYPHVKEIYLEIETITSSKDFAAALADRIAVYNKSLSMPLSYGVNVRATRNCDLRDTFSAFQKANFRFINIGAESGSEKVRKEILRRNYSNQDLINTVNHARQSGLQVGFFNLVGIPGETFQDFQETIEINRVCQPDWHYLSIFFPYPGTDLYDRAREMGIIGNEPLNTDMERSIAVLDLPGFRQRQIQWSYILFDYHVYKGQKPFIKLAVSAFRYWLRTIPALNNSYRNLTNYSLVRRVKSLFQSDYLK